MSGKPLEVKYCRTCDAGVRQRGARFCPYCGSRLEDRKAWEIRKIERRIEWQYGRFLRELEAYTNVTYDVDLSQIRIGGKKVTDIIAEAMEAE